MPGQTYFVNYRFSTAGGSPGFGKLQVLVSEQRFAVAISAAPSQVTLGSNLTYTITVTNNGPAAAPDIALTSVLQPNVALVSIPLGCTGQAGGTIQCGPLSLGSGGSVQLIIVVRALVTPTITNTVSVTPPTIQDPNLANNSARVTTTVVNVSAVT